MDANIILLPEPIPLRPTLPTVLGNVDYQLFRSQLEQIDRMLVRTGLEDQFVEQALGRWWPQQEEPPSAKGQVRFQQQARLALRCNIARMLLNESFRDFSAHLADSTLLQWFCQRQQIDQVRVPSKSALQRFATWFSEEEIRQLNARLLGKAADVATNPFALEQAVDLDAMWLDTTCVQANIHFPVDWVLLRDATRTLLKAIELIRQHGLKHRMPSPAELMGQMNKQCMQMTHARRRPKSRKERKRLLRAMKKGVNQVARHARRYRDLLAQRWPETDWTQAQAEQVLGRIDGILEQLPAAKKQAHERIIGQRKVPNSEKILSLYEPDVHVIVRGKAGAEVEFGNGLLVAENPQGLLLHWQLFQEQPPSDGRLVASTVEAVQERFHTKVHLVGADRGFETQANVRYLETNLIFNGLCARQPGKLRRRLLEEEVYEATQQRRAQTEARIGIFKNVFLGRPLRVKGFDHRNLAVSWAALTHNLWILARLPRKKAPPETLAQPQAA